MWIWIHLYFALQETTVYAYSIQAFLYNGSFFLILEQYLSFPFMDLKVGRDTVCLLLLLCSKKNSYQVAIFQPMLE